MLKVLYGLGEELLEPDSLLWACANCYNCHERCPQQVKPVEVIISLKNMLADRGLAPDPVEKIIRTFETTGRTTPMSAAVDRQRADFGLEPLKPVPVEEIQRLLVAEDQAAARSPGATHATPTPQPERDPALRLLSRLSDPGPPSRDGGGHPGVALARLGIEIVDLEGTSCCPDPIYFKSKDKMSWLAVAARNLCLAEDLGVDIFTNCSGCTATLSECCHLLEDETLRTKVNQRLARIGREYLGTGRVRHVVTLLRDVVGYEAIRASVVRPLTGLRVAIHYGCHLLKPSRIMQVDDPDDPTVLENLVTALGATPVRHRNWYLCCGKACQAEEIPKNMMHDLLGAVSDEEADLLCLICPTCFGQFDHGQVRVAQEFGADFHTPPIYYFQLLALAQGLPYERLGFERQRLKPEAIKRFAADVSAG